MPVYPDAPFWSFNALKIYDIQNVEVVNCFAESMPFEEKFFDLILSNNGINNVEDMKRTLEECYRVCKPNAQLTFTLNLEDTMIEFYDVFQEVLEENNLVETILKMKAHIYSKRKPLKEIKTLLSNKYHNRGKYNIVWDGKDDSGNCVSTGIYLYRFEAGEFDNIKKMLLLR